MHSLLKPKPGSSYRKTKIIATVGPASREPDRLKSLIQTGVNVFRLNFSHGTHEEHLKTLNDIRAVAKDLKAQVAVLQDLSGPKIRISDVKDDYVTIEEGSFIELRPADGSLSDNKKIFVNTLNPATILEVGQRALLADGIIELQVMSIEADCVKCKVSKTGRIRSKVGIAFPDSNFDLPATTEKDLEDMRWGVKHGVDYFAISFVQSAADIVMLRELIFEAGGHSLIIAKIERKSALDNIDDILSVSDGLMVARGDLGVELPFEQLPLIQKRLIEKANFRGVPVIVATQMLHSMITAVRPTRAEVSDIATAVMTGTDAVMLSEETAIGENPLLAVAALGKIAFEAEREFLEDEHALLSREQDLQRSIPDAVAFAAVAAAGKINNSILVAPSASGATARLMAKYRPHNPLYGISANEIALRRMALYWGVIPVASALSDEQLSEAEIATQAVQAQAKLSDGTIAIITGGLSGKTTDKTSVMQVRVMGSEKSEASTPA